MKVLFETRTGSRAYGLQLENSDYDMLRVVMHGPDEYLGLTPYKESAQFKNGKDDVVVYDIRFFGKLLCAGNPNAILPLYFDRENYTVVTREFEQFLLHRRDYLGPKVVDAFRGMARQGAQHFREWAHGDVKGAADWKGAANALYMLTALKGLAWYGGLDYSADRLDFLRNVKAGVVDVDVVLKNLEQYERFTTKENLMGLGTVLNSQESVNEAVNREVRNLLLKCLKS